MATSAIGIGTLTGLKPPGHRSNGYCTTIVLTIASCAYFAMVRTHSCFARYLATSEYSCCQGHVPHHLVRAHLANQNSR